MATFTTAEMELHYDRVGEGPPVIFVQGVGVAGCGWAPQVEALRDRYTCITFDNRGLGGSRALDDAPLTVAQMADDAIALCEHLGLGPVHWVGHSLGGVIVQRVALTRPDLARSLALVCTFAGGRDLAKPALKLIWYGARSRLGSAGMRRRAFARLVTAPADLVDSTIASLEAAFGRSLATPWPIADAQLAALRAHDERERLGELAAIRTLVVSGAYDLIARPAAGRALAEAIPGATFVELPAGHALPIQHAADLNARLGAHLASPGH